MLPRAFFFQDDMLLLPDNFPDSEISKGIPLELSKVFENPDIFEIPALDIDAGPIQAVSVLPETVLPDSWKSIPVRQVFSILSSLSGCQGQIVSRACHIAQWRRDSLFCGRCGGKNSDVSGDIQRNCLDCGRAEFPRICPAVIVVITDDKNKILLAHNKRFKKGVYSHISGFNEAGETLEETAAREIREEVNIEVKDIVYIQSQPWPFPNSLMVGFKARYSSGELQPDGIEIEDAKWFTKDNLPELPGEGSLSRFLINRWLDNTL
jgi:NAD+ diphosphatase